MRRPIAPLLLWVGLLVSGCNDELVDPVDGGAGHGPDGGSAGIGGGGGDGGGGGPAPDRGDLATFPDECVETCQEACDRIVTCGSEESQVHPIGMEDCLLRCGTATTGPLWDDVSGPFRCCASQPECADAAHCGGWLAYPSVVEPCEKICECFFSSTVAALTAEHDAPRGYRFAPDALFVDAASSADIAAIAGVKRVQMGRYRLVTLGPAERAATLADLGAAGRLLPTFIDRDGRLSAATERLVVRAKAPDDAAAVADALRPFAVGSPRKVRFSNDLYVIEATDPWAALDAMREAAHRGLDAELDMVRIYETRSTPNDPLYEDQWHLSNIGQGPSTASVDVRADEAWDVTEGSASVVIAINDDGVDLNHPEFAGKLAPELNYPDDWESQMAAGLFGQHGTSVAGVAAAKGNNLFAGSGACSDCTILPHLLGETTGLSFQVTDTEIADGFEEQVDAGAWIISNSWGISTGNPVYQEPSLPIPGLSSVVKASLDYAEASGRGGLGTVIVFAAGNSNDVLEPLGAYETNVNVGAVNDLGLKSYYSSFGPLLDVAAPSNGGLAGITTTAANSQTTDSFGGTSSACPLVSGVIGLIFSANANLTAAQARDILYTTATKIDPVFGAYDVMGVSPFYGHGMVNAARAVRLAAGLCADAASCKAPSDDCAGACGTKTTCDICRTHADCALGSVCQAMPSLGILTCVAPKEPAVACPNDTNEVGGYCLPTPSRCGLCAPGETCNGRDDDCNGVADDADICAGPARCFFEGPGCGDGMTCAGTTCTPTCSADEDCAQGYVCQTLKTAYGDLPGTKGCVLDQVSSCQLGCEVIASSLDDDPLAEFTACMEGAACNEAFGCTSLLPINM